MFLKLPFAVSCTMYVYVHMCIYIYIYMFVGCVVLVINKSTTKQDNMRHST